MSQCPAVLLVLPFLCLQFLTSRGQTLTPAKEIQLDQFVNEVMRCGQLQALGLSLVSEERVRFEQGWGYLGSSERSPRATRDSIFCLGGATQAFTSVLLSNLLARSNYTMDTPLQEIIGRVDLPGDFRSRNVNLKDILGMRTGLSNMDIKALSGFEKHQYQRDLTYAPEVQPFRADNVYSEGPFSYAEDAARRLGGEVWYTLLRQHLLHPLNLSSASRVHTDAWARSDLAKPVLTWSGSRQELPQQAFRGQEAVSSATSLCLSVSDMGKWMNFILSSGKTATGRQLVSDEVIRSTFKAVNTRGNGGDSRTSGFSQPAISVSYTRESNALGWIKGHYHVLPQPFHQTGPVVLLCYADRHGFHDNVADAARTVVTVPGFTFMSQDGWLPGYEALATLLPDRQLGVFTAFTGSNAARAYAAKVLVNMYALNVLLEAPTALTAASACKMLDVMTDITRRSQPRLAAVSAGQPARPLRNYEGIYRDFGFGAVTVQMSDDGKNLELTYGTEGKWRLTPTSINDTFVMDAMGTLWFTTASEDSPQRGQHLASFRSYPNSEAIESVVLPLFSRDTVPLFSRNPARPARPALYDYNARCTCAGLYTSIFVLVTSIIMAGLVGP